jgi:hypothetical protein
METEAVFKARGTATAIRWAGEALKHATAMEAAVAAGKWDDVKPPLAPFSPCAPSATASTASGMDDGHLPNQERWLDRASEESSERTESGLT